MTDSERMLLKSVQMKPEVYISISIWKENEKSNVSTFPVLPAQSC